MSTLDRGNEMSNSEISTDSGAHLIALVINQDQVIQGWVKFLITIESALAVGLGFILKIGMERAEFKQFTPWAIVLIPAFGILASIVLCIIIVRERKWTAWYVQQFNEPSGQRQVFPGKKGEPNKNEVANLELSFVSWAII